MQAMRRILVAATTTLTVACIIAPSGGRDVGERETTGGAVGKTVDSGAKFTQKGNPGEEAGPLKPVRASNWNPPPCWYEPRWGAREYKEMWDRRWQNEDLTSVPSENIAEHREYYENGEPYEDYNIEKDGEGMWWIPVQNPNSSGDMSACERDPFWVDDGDTPDVPQAIDTETLAMLAYERARVPDTKVTMNPANQQKVNLPTWMWLNASDFKPVEVTASIPGTGLSATTTAEPISLSLRPGTPDAQTHPANGQCPINNGKIGVPYTKGNAKEVPPCGVTYKRATNDKPHQLQATLTWKVSWEGSDGDSGDLPNGTFETTQPISVEEVQSINR